MNALERAWWRRQEAPADRALLAPLLPLEGAFRAAVALRGGLHPPPRGRPPP